MTPRAIDLVMAQSGVARFLGRRFPCATGRGGFTSEKREGDGAAPLGVHRLASLCYRPDRLRKPATVLPARPIRAWDGWCDEVGDPAYNRDVRLPYPASCERMRRSDPLYDLVVVTDVNRSPVIPGAGSAIFLHIWRAPRFPTAGCVAFPKRRLLWILENWRPDSRLILR